MKIHQYIPSCYVNALCNKGLHFSPCSSFVDKLEFRFGYCYFEFGASTPEQIDHCVATTFSKPEVNDIIHRSHISCWTQDSNERYAMWEVYGRSSPAIRITVEADNLFSALKTNVQRKGTAGPVTYNFEPSQVEPEFINWPFGKLTKAEEEWFHLFFHKHDFYRWEQEYRFVLFSKESVFQLDARSLVLDVVVSPLQEMPADDQKLLVATFGTKVRPSDLKNPYT